MSKKVTIYDIAREAGVSTATVTRVFRHDPHVSEATRVKVQQIIDAHDYTPSLSAQNLEGGRTRTLALVLPVVSNLYFNRIFDAAYWEAEKNGCSVRLFQTMENQAISPEIVNELGYTVHQLRYQVDHQGYYQDQDQNQGYDHGKHPAKLPGFYSAE